MRFFLSYCMVLIFLFCGIAVIADEPTSVDSPAQTEQQSESAPSQDTQQPIGEAQKFNTFEKGDGILSLALGAAYTLGFVDPSKKQGQGPNSYPGFTFALSYTGFLTPHWHLTGEISGCFLNTRNKERLFIAPFALRAGYAFPIKAFTIMPSAGLGLAISSMGDYKHVDMLIRFGSSFKWKASNDMSYDFNLFFNIIPQIFTKYPENTRIGFFADTMFAISYYL